MFGTDLIQKVRERDLINKLAKNPSAFGIIFGALCIAIYPLFDTSLTKVISPRFEGVILGFVVAAAIHFVGSERAANISLKRDLAAMHDKKTRTDKENEPL